jgi:hypothetical protein
MVVSSPSFERVWLDEKWRYILGSEPCPSPKVFAILGDKDFAKQEEISTFLSHLKPERR